LNGRIAKRLEKYARYLLTQEGVPLGDGFGHYNQLENCISWEPAYTDGHHHEDPHEKTTEEYFPKDFLVQMSSPYPVDSVIQDVSFVRTWWVDPNVGHMRMRDPDGVPLKGMFKRPGTIQCAWKKRIIYQNLKRLWKQTKGGHPVFKEFHRTSPKNYFSGTGGKGGHVPSFQVRKGKPSDSNMGKPGTTKKV